ncbi:MAG TPA: RNA methyltransferase [Pyrinomonadaceae bacterium]|jgi:TrmH family RNA methyltransferase|nr:RNA methyltransferase [Pyrinomonadaceae bacterium]
MSRVIINSRDNPLVKHARAVRDGRERELVFVEGVRLCEEVVGANLSIEDVLYTERAARDERGSALLRALQGVSQRLSEVSEQVLASVSDMKTPQGIVALVSRPSTNGFALESGGVEVPLLLVMHRTNNPANAGALVRTAEAAGATGVMTTAGSTDLFSPKALRGAMGSAFRLPLWTGAEYAEVLAWCGARGIKTVCADARAKRAYTEIDWTIPSALIVGPEATGLSDEEAAGADESVSIPMRSPVESLNVAVASAVLLYEAARQRRIRVQSPEPEQFSS